MRRARSGYYALITHVDHQVNRFLESLVTYGVDREETIILFLSDHGELLGDHGLFRKYLPYDGSARVPFILHLPRGNNAATGLVVEELVELRDLMPTVLELAGVPVPEGVQGRSVLPLLQGKHEGWREYLHGEHDYFGAGGQSVHFIVSDRHKYVWFSRDGGEQLFDRREDPQELRDLSSSGRHAAQLEELRGCLIRELTGREEGYVEEGRLVPGRPPSTFLSRRMDPKMR